MTARVIGFAGSFYEAEYLIAARSKGSVKFTSDVLQELCMIGSAVFA